MSKYAIIFPLPGKPASATKERYWMGRDVEEVASTEDSDSFSIDVEGHDSKMSTSSIASDSYSSFDTNQNMAESVAVSLNKSSCRVVVLDARLDLELLEYSVKKDFSAQVPRCLFGSNRPLPPSENTNLREKRIIQNATQFDLMINIGNKECLLMKTFADFSRLRSELEHEFAEVRKFEQLGFEGTTGKFNIPDLPLIQSPDCNGTFRTMIRQYLTTYGKTIEAWLQSLINSFPPTESPGLMRFFLEGRL